VKVRYRTPAAPAWVLPRESDAADVRFDQPQRAITSGQAAVFYQGDLVVGGGTIVENIRANLGSDPH